MSEIITCPFCQFRKEVPSDKLPRQNASVSCPNCRQRFSFTPAGNTATKDGSNIDQPSMQSATQPPGITLQSSGHPVVAVPDMPIRSKTEPWTNLDIRNLTRKQSSAVGALVLIVLCLVGVRLWADAQARSVPFPNMIATKADEVAVTWGEQILVYDKAGKNVSNFPMPKDAVPAHLSYDSEGNLWLGDYLTKQIFRRQGGQWQKVINGAGTIRGTFKFVQFSPTGEVFVTDTTNHRILTYSATGQFLRAFAKEGREQGEVLFPNEILLFNDDLLVTNTNAGRLDLFSQDGKFIRTFKNTEKDGLYQFPTLMTWLDGGWFAYLQTVDLSKAKAIVCDSEGKRIGEFRPPNPLSDVGDIAFIGGKAIISDISDRQVYTFDAANFDYLGPLNLELVDRGISANDKESAYQAMATASLYGLLALCIAGGFVLYRVQRRQSTIAPATAGKNLPVNQAVLWGVPTDTRQLVPMAITFVVVLLLKFKAADFNAGNPYMTAGSIVVMLAAVIICIRSLMASGLGNMARLERLQQLLRKAWPKLATTLLEGEDIIGCTVVRHSKFNKKPTLLIITDRRLLMARFEWKMLKEHLGELRYLPFAQIAKMQITASSLSSGWASRMLKAEEFELLVLQADRKPSSFISFNRDILEKVKGAFEQQQKSTIAATMAEVAKRPAEDVVVATSWRAALLSALYPGLGQFHNRQLIKGSILAVMFTLELLFLTGPAIKIMERSAELRKIDIPFLVAGCLFITMTWVISITDAWRAVKLKQD